MLRNLCNRQSKSTDFEVGLRRGCRGSAPPLAAPGKEEPGAAWDGGPAGGARPARPALARGLPRRPKLVGPGDLLGKVPGYVDVDEVAAEADPLESGSE